MPRNSTNKTSSSNSHKIAQVHPTTPTTAATRPSPTTQVIHHGQQSSVWSGVKTGFGMTIGNKIVNLMFGDPVVRHINDTSTSNIPKSTVGAAATQDMTGQIQYMQCMKEGGTEEVCKEHLA
jgi:hypothetical protein